MDDEDCQENWKENDDDPLQNFIPDETSALYQEVVKHVHKTNTQEVTKQKRSYSRLRCSSGER